jgi:hypothetical protein
MSSEFIPVDVKHFILSRIDSVAQLEALLLLRSNVQPRWTVEAVARRLYISEDETGNLLETLRADGFLIIEPNTPRVYRYQPSSAELATLVDQVADIYSKHLVPVTNLIHSKPRTRVSEFADAFKLRKDK